MPSACPANILFQHLSKQWVLNIFHQLEQGESSFNGLKRALGGISSKTLSARLKELQANGYLIRNVESETPLQVNYHLTEKGQSLSKEIKHLEDWAKKGVYTL